jgi:hypothetical protein
MIGPERHQPLDEARLGQGRALQARQRLGAEGLHDDVNGLRCFALRGVRWTHHVGLRRFTLLHGAIGHLRSGRRRLGLRLGFTLLAHLGIEGKERLAEFRRRPQRGLLEQRRAWPRQFGPDETARIRGRAGEIAGRAAARSKAEAVQGNQCTLRIARQLRFLFPPESTGSMDLFAGSAT